MTSLKELRRLRGLTLAQLAQSSTVDLSTLCRIERGEYRAGKSVRNRLARALKWPVDQIRELHRDPACSREQADRIVRLLMGWE